MKYVIVLICIGFMSCNSTSKETKISTYESLDWLVGEWIRTNGEAGETTVEIWEKDGNLYNGSAFTILKGDTVFQEKIRAYYEDTQWHYEVNSATEIPITFTSTSISDTSFVCENPANDFPNTIAYIKDGKCVNATISNDGNDEILFRYEKRIK